MPPIQNNIDALPPLKEVMKQYGLHTKKKLGQHFLFDLNLTDKIIRSAGAVKNTVVLEIGPGIGSLTRSILRNEPFKLIAVEHDTDCKPALEQLQLACEDKLTVIYHDALQIDERALLKPYQPDHDMHIIANLPYNVGTELLFKWLEMTDLFSSMTLMFQKEVAERVIASPSTKHYGRLAVYAQWQWHTARCFDVPASAFHPPPKVESTVIRLTPRAQPLAEANAGTLKKLCHATFTQRRKMLRASLKQLTDNPAELLNQANIEATRRPETLSVEEFCALARAYDEL